MGSSASARSPEQAELGFGIAGTPISTPGFRSATLRLLDRLLLRVPRRIAAWGHALRTTRRLDAVVIPGTGVLDDLWHGPGGFPYILFRWCLAARLSGTPLYFVSVGAGPILHPLSRLLMLAAARMACYRSYRDAASRDFMAGLGVSAAVDRIFPDLAFGLPAPPVAIAHDRIHLSVAVGVMTYAGRRRDQPDGPSIYGRYVAAMARFLRWLLDQRYRVRLITGEASDQQALDDILRTLAVDGGIWLRNQVVTEPATSLHDIMRQIADADVVVATRFHNVVCALRLGKPVLSIGYAPKNDDLLAEMGLGAFCQHIERLDEALLRQQFLRLVEERREHAQQIPMRVTTCQDRLREQETLLARLLLAAAPVEQA